MKKSQDRNDKAMILFAATPASGYSELTASDAPSEMRSEPVRPVMVTPSPSGNGQGTVADQVDLSPQGIQLSRNRASGSGQVPKNLQAQESTTTESEQRLSAEEQRAVQELKQRDREVRAHEQAHLATAGQYAAGGPSYTYQTGPDGRRYAIGGEVPIDVSKEKTPEQTIRKMQTVRQAALAPANPSGADRAIAARAAMRQSEAVRELNQEKISNPDASSGQNRSRQAEPAASASGYSSSPAPIGKSSDNVSVRSASVYA